MAYRFSDTSKWSDGWFVDLKPMEKFMFMYMCDTCDIAGFYELSMRKLRFDLGLNDADIKASLKGLEKGYILSIDKRILFIKNFIKHQKNLPLNASNKSHKGIISRFDHYKDKFNIDFYKHFNITKNKENDADLKGLFSPYGKGIGNIIDIKEENKGIDFNDFWNLYNKKLGNKKAVQKKWYDLKPGLQKRILDVLPEWKKQFSDLQFMPYPETFLNQERWNDEVVINLPAAEKGLILAM